MFCSTASARAPQSCNLPPEFRSPLNRGSLCVALAHYAQDSNELMLGLQHILELWSSERKLAHEFARPANEFVGYSVAVHTIMAIEQRRKYNLGGDLSVPTSNSSPHVGTRGVECALWLHDLGKYMPGESKNAHAEHARTLNCIRPFLERLPFSEQQVNVIVNLIDNDSLGDGLFLKIFSKRPPREDREIAKLQVRQGNFDRTHYHELVDRWQDFSEAHLVDSEKQLRIIESCAQSFKFRATKLGLSPIELFDLQVAYYQADTSAYTLDANGLGVQAAPAIDYIFERDQKRTSSPLFRVSPRGMRLQFSTMHERIFLRLRERILEMEASANPY